MKTARGHRAVLTFPRWALSAALVLTPAAVFAQAAAPAAAPAAALASAPAGTTLERVHATGKLALGYFAGAQPLSYRNAAGNADGYGPALCRGIAAVMKSEISRPDVQVQFVPVGGDALDALRDGRIDILCGPLEPSISRRAIVSFSIPVFNGGTGVLMRKDVSPAFRDIVEGRTPETRALWRGQPQLAALNQRDFAVVAGSTTERRLRDRKLELGVKSTITPVADLAAGLKRVVDGQSAALVADRSVLLDLAHNSPNANDVMVVDRLYDHTMLSLGVRRNDDDFRLLVDKVLSRLYRTGRIDEIYQRHMGTPDAGVREWFRRMGEPE